MTNTPYKFRNKINGDTVMSPFGDALYWYYRWWSAKDKEWNNWELIEKDGKIIDKKPLIEVKSENGPLKLLIEKLVKISKRNHYYNDMDDWYSCPLSPMGCSDERETVCNCGADAQNKEVEEIEEKIKELLD